MTPARIRANRAYYRRHREAVILQNKKRNIGVFVSMVDARLMLKKEAPHEAGPNSSLEHEQSMRSLTQCPVHVNPEEVSDEDHSSDHRARRLAAPA